MNLLQEIRNPTLTDLLNLAKLSALVGSAMGLFMMLSYLRSVSAPFPSMDAVSSVTLLIIFATYAFFGFYVQFILFAPAVLCYVSPSTRWLARTRSVRIQGKLLRPINKLGSDFVIHHSSSIAAITVPWLVLLVLIYFKPSVRAEWLFLFLPVSAFGGALLSRLWFKWYGVHAVRFQKRLNYRKRSKFISRVFFESLMRGLMAGIWSTLVILMLYYIFRPERYASGSPDWVIILFIIVFDGVLCVLYVFSTAISRQMHLFPVLLLMCLFLGTIYAPSHVGAFSLRFLGLGGGIPISVTFRSMQSQGVQSSLSPVEGCLIFNSGNSVIIQEMVGPSLDKCIVPFTVSSRDYKIPSMFESVKLYPGAEVRVISKPNPSHP